MRNKIEAVNSAQTNFKMYKKGKQWLFASAVALVALGATSVASTAHADTTTSDQPQVVTTQASGNGNQETITTYPHKDQIDQAVQSVQNTPHLSVTQDPDQTITGSSQAEIDQKIQDDYNQQQQYLKQRQDEAKRSATQQSNYQTYNETHGDTSQIDQAAKDAQNIPGLTVVKDSDIDSSFDAEDTTGLQNWATNTQKDYQSQVDEFNKAIDTQKRNESEYDNAMNDYNAKMAKLNQGANAPVISTNSVNQALSLKPEHNATVNVEALNPNITFKRTGVGTPYAQYQIFDKNNAYVNNINGNFLRVTYTNLKNSTYKGSKISKIVVTYSDSAPTGNRITQGGLDAIKDGANDNFLCVFEDPVRCDMHSTNVNSTYQFYDANGNLIDFSGTNDAWLSVGSLNFDQGNPTAGISEGVKVISGAQIKQLAGSSISVHDDGWAYAAFNNYSDTGMNNGINTDNGGSGWDMDGSPYAYYGAIVFQLTGTSVTLRQGIIPWGGADIASQYSNQGLNNAWFTAGTTLPETKIKQPVRKTSEVHYHYNTKKERAW